MVIGLKYGKGEHGLEADKANAYKLSQLLIDKFKVRHQSINCLELLDNLDINTPEGMAEIQKRDLFRCNCSKYVQDAVELVESILA